MHPRAILLDLDGTLADSLPVLRLAYRDFLRQFQLSPTDAEFDSINGPPLAEVVRRLKAAHGLPGGEEELLAGYRSAIDRVYACVAPRFGARELLQKARVNKCSIGIVTSNSAERARAWVEEVTLANLIDFIVSADDVRYGKPNPEPYMLAARRASCALSTIVAVEDSPLGARSAVAAGLKTYVLTGEPNETNRWPRDVQRIETLRVLSEQLW